MTRLQSSGMNVVNILLFDSGNPFDNKAPERLDERENTTDGTGHGLADVFESMAKSSASFVIEKLDKKRIYKGGSGYY